MDKLAAELLLLLRQILASQQQLLQLALLRRDAMRTFDIQRLEMLIQQEKAAAQNLAALDRRRQNLLPPIRALLGRQVEANVTEIARRCQEPLRIQLLTLAAQVRDTVELVERNNRINAKVSDAVIKGLAKVLKVVTGLAQHAGLYMRNGRKAALHGIHLLEVTA